ncbi:hypothetical protein [Alicyclobacillus fastidiosus]|uniref:DNA-binding anti-repressor SinI n=1 Tax=Alicyclobacillus fastidiosus TaxID=392011 RepID=A0ABV5AF25_9BACL|nr:hypothetical protein [Alicyclobacillus fastidiosus]WEH09472.1 hypothetical protein PYS47_22985 [Alicyclobacillus fastidiosus]
MNEEQARVEYLEWLKLMGIARALGVSKEDVQAFLSEERRNLAVGAGSEHTTRRHTS